mmetsp:Transcript_115574/g.326737  ORF Transcript_115574/g.326737 Transcript_115574/m.326737 type:complete len:443 (-) Transcript_115574:349-1677(-)
MCKRRSRTCKKGLHKRPQRRLALVRLAFAGSFENILKTLSQERLVHRLPDEDDLRYPLFTFLPRTSVVLVAGVHDRMEHVLEGVIPHSEDGLDSEDCAALCWEASQRLHPLAELPREDVALPHDRERIYTGVVPAVTMTMAVAMTTIVASAMAGGVAAAMITIMAATVTVVLGAILVVAVAAPVAAPVAASVAGVSAMATVIIMANRLCHIGLFLEINVDEVRHVVGADVREFRHLDAAFHGRQDLGEFIDGSDPVLAIDRLLCRAKIKLVQDHLVGKGDLLVRLINFAFLDLVVKTGDKVLRVCDCHHSVEPEVRCELRIGHESADDGHWVSHSGGLDHDGINLAPLLHVCQNLLEPICKVPADRAAHASIVHNYDFLRQLDLALLKQRVVDRNLAELVLDDRDLFLTLFLQDVIQERGLTGAEEACKNRDWRLVLLLFLG